MVFISLAQCHGGGGGGGRPWIVYTFGKTVPDSVPVMRTGSWPFCLCTSLTSRLMIVVFGLGTRLRVHMRTKLENVVLSKGQQPQSVVKGSC